MQENTVRESNVVEMPVQNNGDDYKILEKAEIKITEMMPVLISNFIRTGAKSAMSLKIVLQYNKDEEAEVTVDGTLSLATEQGKLVGEVIGKQLRLW
jgi:hypothetical protein